MTETELHRATVLLFIAAMQAVNLIRARRMVKAIAPDIGIEAMAVN